MSERHPDLLIVGGGVIGLSIADVAARRGLRVTVLERERVGARASWAAAGMLNCRPWPRNDPARPTYHDLIQASLKLYPVWAERLREETEIDIGYRRCGALELISNPEPTSREAENLARRLEGCAEHGVPARRITPREARELEPGLDVSNLHSAIHFSNDGQVRNPRLLKALASACRGREVALREGIEVADVWIEEGRARGAIARDGKRYSGNKVIVCAGAWTAQFPNLVRSLPYAAKIEPVRGQMVCYQTPAPLARGLLTREHQYLVPREDGILLAGSTTEHAGYEGVTTPNGQAELRAFAESLLPALKGQEPLMGWADLRPGVKGSGPHPILGPVPEVEHLYIASGHYRNGIGMAPITGEIMVALFLGEKPPVPIETWMPK